MSTPLELAIFFHETYERLAPEFGYETRSDTKKFDPESKNGRLMVAVCGEVCGELEAIRADAEKLAGMVLTHAAELRIVALPNERERIIDLARNIAGEQAVADAPPVETFPNTATVTRIITRISDVSTVSRDVEIPVTAENFDTKVFEAIADEKQNQHFVPKS